MNKGVVMRAIVLSGGGSKGAYQMGVWKALRKLHISYDIVTGTSVGALNAAMMTQKTYFKGLWMWYNLEFNQVIDEPMNIDIHSKDGKKQLLKMYAKGAINGGISITNLENTLEKVLNIEKIYSSPINLGIVTVKLRKLTPVLLTKKQIKPNHLKDYLIASASCFPAFKKKVIAEESYVDGGIYDNLPINLAINMGATEVIAVDLDEIGLKQKVKNKKIPITLITPKNNIGSFLVFDKITARRAIRLGYNDTMKKFTKLDGNYYTFKKNHLALNYKYYKKYYKNEIEKHIDFKNRSLLEKIYKITAIKRLFNDSKEEKMKESFDKVIEQLGQVLEIDDSYIYSIFKYNELLIKKFIDIQSISNIKESVEKNRFKKLFSNKETIKYIYNLIINKDSSIHKYILLFPNEFLAAIYLKIIIEK